MILLIGFLFLFLYAGINYYIGLRAWQNMACFLPLLDSRLYWILFWCLSMSYLAARLIGKFMPDILRVETERVGAYWLAAMFYLLLSILLIDLVRITNRRLGFLPVTFSQNPKVMLAMSIAVLLFVAALLVYGTWASSNIMTTSYSIQIHKKTDKIHNLKLVMLSDLHLGNIIDNRRLTAMVDHINALKPDLVLIPGDLIDDVTEPFVSQRMGDNFKRIHSRLGVYACLGNHDGMLQSADKTEQVLEKAGIHVLRDEAVLIEDSFYLIGREDETVFRGSKQKRKDLAQILSPLDQQRPILVMDHQPYRLEEPELLGVDLQVSGHTHRGQIFPSNLITGLIYEIDYGFLRKGNLNVVVSSGIGTWGPPIRIGSRAELVKIQLEFSK